MYQEKKSGVNWLKVLLKVFIAILVVLLVIKLGGMLLSKHKDKVVDGVMNNNLTIMNKVAVDYFKDDKMPTEVGDTNKVSLKELVAEQIISDIKDQAGKKCNYDDSYIQITKLDNDYQYKSYLVCGNTTKFKNSYSSKKQEDITSKLETTKKSSKKKNKKKTTTTKATKKTTAKTTEKATKDTTTTSTTKTTKKTTTTKATTRVTYTTTTIPANKVEVSFNTNGGALVDSIVIDKGSRLTSIPTTTREGATFLGWYYHGELYSFASPIEENIVLVAKWR
jgi:hypothetical protein